MRRNFLFLGILALYLASLSGCGGGSGGAPGSSGEENTGITIKSVQLVETGGDAGTTGNEVDVAIHLCDEDPEPGLFMHSMIMNIAAEKLNPNVTATPFPASVEQCIITYKKANEDPASPIIESFTTFPNCTLVEAGTTAPNQCTITLMDIERKTRWWAATVGGLNIPSEYPTHYVASVWCKYMNNFGRSGAFQVEFDIWLADWNLCS